MADQLSLRLEADGLPDLPDLRPMLPRPLPAPFDSDEHLFEPWWGGERALVAVGPAGEPGGGEVVVRDGSGRDVTAALPELAGLAVRVAARSAILDGELVVVDRRRTRGSRRTRAAPHRASRVVRSPSSRSICCISMDDRCCRSRSSAGARRSVACSVRATRSWRCRRSRPRGSPCSKRRSTQGIAGILARQRASPYLPGVRSRLWRFVAARPGPEGAAGADEEVGTEGPGAAAAPVLALISRLPLDEE